MFSNEVGSFCSSLGRHMVGKEKTMSKPKGRKALLLYGQGEHGQEVLPEAGSVESILIGVCSWTKKNTPRQAVCRGGNR